MRRLQNAGLAVLLLALAGLVASSVMGVGGNAAPAVAVRTAAGPVAEPPAGRARVEVLNASGRPGLARTVMLYLRGRGFDVVYEGNAGPAEGTATRVLDRAHHPALARQVADSLGIATVATVPDPSLMLDATVVLGRDWKAPAGMAEAAPAASDSASAAALDTAHAQPPRAAPAAPRQAPAAAPRAAGSAVTKPVSSIHPHSAPVRPARAAPKH